MKAPLFCILFAGACVSLQADDIQPLGDEFNDAASFVQWQDLGIVEGWERPSVEAADIHTTTPGHFRIVPGAITWFGNLQGALFFKEISGDFVATLRMRALSRHNPADPMEVPIRNFSLSGILAHGPVPGWSVLRRNHTPPIRCGLQAISAATGNRTRSTTSSSATERREIREHVSLKSKQLATATPASISIKQASIRMQTKPGCKWCASETRWCAFENTQ